VSTARLVIALYVEEPYLAKITKMQQPVQPYIALETA
jgi:hypothetical protein